MSQMFVSAAVTTGRDTAGGWTHWTELQMEAGRRQLDPSPSCYKPTLGHSRADPEMQPQKKHLLTSRHYLGENRHILAKVYGQARHQHEWWTSVMLWCPTRTKTLKPEERRTSITVVFGCPHTFGHIFCTCIIALCLVITVEHSGLYWLDSNEAFQFRIRLQVWLNVSGVVLNLVLNVIFTWSFSISVVILCLWLLFICVHL